MKEVIQYYNLWLEFETEKEKLKKLNLPYYTNPSTLNERMCNWQHEYLVDKNKNSETKLWQEFYKLCEKIIKKEQKLKGFYADQDEIEMKSGTACDYVMRRYSEHAKSNGSIYFIKNFISAAYEAMRHAVYHEEENDFILDKCKTLNGKPLLILKEVDFSVLKEKITKEKIQTTIENPDQLLLFEKE